MKREKEYFRGCLVGGAVGDALGWPVEFLKMEEIVQRYGSGGISEPELGFRQSGDHR